MKTRVGEKIQRETEKENCVHRKSTDILEKQKIIHSNSKRYLFEEFVHAGSCDGRDSDGANAAIELIERQTHRTRQRRHVRLLRLQRSLVMKQPFKNIQDSLWVMIKMAKQDKHG
jgi:hypothetical protein